MDRRLIEQTVRQLRVYLCLTKLRTVTTFRTVAASLDLSAIYNSFGIMYTGTDQKRSTLDEFAPAHRNSPTRGTMISDVARALRSYPNQAIFPTLALAVTMFAFNFLGDGLRDAFDPRLRSTQ
jgi:hypothetical protein